MNTFLKASLLMLASGCFSLPAFAQGTWTAGLVGTTTYAEKWTPAVLPWVSYRSETFTANPMKVAAIGEQGPLHWEAGIGLDYGELFDQTERGFLIQGDAQYFLGPLRLTLGGASRVIDPFDAWQSSTTVGSQFPVGSGLLGVEVGAHAEASAWDDDVKRENAVVMATAGVQYGLQFGPWQTMAMAQFQSPALSTNELAKQTYTILIMRNW